MSITALLIEDNEQNRYLLTFLLEQHGFRVVSAVDGPSALALAPTVLPDIILLDIQLPVMDGYQVAAALRQIPLIRRTPIVAVTSYAMIGDKERAIAAGCTAYLEKPIDPDTFASEVTSFCTTFD